MYRAGGMEGRSLRVPGQSSIHGRESVMANRHVSFKKDCSSINSRSIPVSVAMD